MFLIRRILRFLLGCAYWTALCLGAFFLGMFTVAVLESWQLDQQTGALEAEPLHPNVEAVSRHPDTAPASFARPAAPSAPDRLAPGALLGRVQIDRLDIDAVVLEGIDESILRRAVGHFPGTRLPWQPGTVGLAAHRDSFFRNLKHVEEGDVVRLVTEHGAWSYEVTGLRVVEPDEVGVLDDRATPGLTLVTCYPFDFLGAAPQRFVVTARHLQADMTHPPGS